MKSSLVALISAVGTAIASPLANAGEASASFEPAGAYDEGGLALLSDNSFEAIEALIEQAFASAGIKPGDRIAYIQVVRHNEKEIAADKTAPLREEVMFLGRAADDYRKPPVELKNGPTISDISPWRASVKIEYNPTCRLKKVGSKYKLVPSGCDN